MSNNSPTVMYREMYTVHVYEYIELYRTHMQYTVCIHFSAQSGNTLNSLVFMKVYPFYDWWLLYTKVICIYTVQLYGWIKWTGM